MTQQLGQSPDQRQPASDPRHELEELRQAYAIELRERQRIEQELRQSQQLLQLVMDTLPEAIFWKDRDSVYLGCNQNFAEDAGVHNPQAIVGKTDYDLAWKTEEADFFRACDQQVIASRQAAFGIIEPQLQDDGKQAWLETNKAPLLDIDGNVIGLLGTYQDVTARKDAEIKLHELNQQLQQQTLELNCTIDQLQQSQMELIKREKASALGNLVSGIAHEINNPLGFLAGNLKPASDYIQDLFSLIDAYQSALPEPPTALADLSEELDIEYIRTDLPKLISSMREGVNRIKNISTSLRTFSRSDTASKITFQIHDGIDSTLMILRHRLKGNNDRPAIQVHTHYDPNLPEIICFPGQLNQVFMNLLANAIEAIEEANADRHLADLEANPGVITISTHALPDQVAIHIRDNGVGMNAAVQAQIFEHLFTTKAVGQGTGLGLAISHQIITEKHQGHIHVNSTIGEGTEFVIELPISD